MIKNPGVGSRALVEVSGIYRHTDTIVFCSLTGG